MWCTKRTQRSHVHNFGLARRWHDLRCTISLAPRIVQTRDSSHANRTTYQSDFTRRSHGYVEPNHQRNRTRDGLQFLDHTKHNAPITKHFIHPVRRVVRRRVARSSRSAKAHSEHRPSFGHERCSIPTDTTDYAADGLARGTFARNALTTTVDRKRTRIRTHSSARMNERRRMEHTAATMTTTTTPATT